MSMDLAAIAAAIETLDGSLSYEFGQITKSIDAGTKMTGELVNTIDNFDRGFGPALVGVLERIATALETQRTPRPRVVGLIPARPGERAKGRVSGFGTVGLADVRAWVIVDEDGLVEALPLVETSAYGGAVMIDDWEGE